MGILPFWREFTRTFASRFGNIKLCVRKHKRVGGSDGNQKGALRYCSRRE